MPFGLAKRTCSIEEKVQHQETAIIKIKNIVNFTQNIQNILFKNSQGIKESSDD